MGQCITTEGCSGETCSNVVTETKARRVVQHADDVPLRVCITSSDVLEFDHTIMCEVSSGVPTGAKVLVVVTYDQSGVPTKTYTDLATGLAWTGDPATELAACDDGTDIELEKTQMCDDGTDFIRWYVLENRSPSGVYYDTDLTGASYTPTSSISVGACFETNPIVTTPDGITVTGVTPTSAPTSKVKSITVTALIENVTVTTTSGSILVTQGSSFSWGEGNQNDLDASGFTFTGSSATAQYALHWEE